MLLQHSPGEVGPFTLTYGLESCPLGSQIQTANAGEEGQMR